MLPDMRAVFAALVAAIGLLMIAFGAVAALRVAQESHAGSFQTDLARRGQTVLPNPSQRVAVIETPGPHLAPPPPLPVVEVQIAPVGAEVSVIPVARETVQQAVQTTAQGAPPVTVAAQREDEPPAVVETPVGGPLAAPAPPQSEAHRVVARAERAKKLAAARKAREARIARQRKAAAVRRAAQARAKQQAATPSFNNGFGNQSFGNSGFGSTFGKQ